ncbi:EthD domain-containing protein [Microbacterium sp. YJN-G]|uniref:EthD domain-containing protein n=1 Tax=Microbacterium sp. YJN-G TaxID=2763257 RepID=UPI001877F0C7|nr:EthD domain-containing protein [Microbacterium sp. YJN-G]
MASAYKLTLLFTRRADLEPDDFATAWLALERARPLAADGLSRSAIHIALPGVAAVRGAASAPYDAVLETWWERKNDAANWVVSRQFDDEWMPPRLELLAGRPAAVGGAPVLAWERDGESAGADDRAAAAITVITLPVARRGLRFDEFAKHWNDVHTELALSGAGAKDRLLRLENTPAPVPAPTRFARTNFNGVGSITFRSIAALEEEFSSEHYLDRLAADEERFTNTEASAVFVGRPVT